MFFFSTRLNFPRRLYICVFQQADRLQELCAETSIDSYPCKMRSLAVLWLDDYMVIKAKMFSHLETKLLKQALDIQLQLELQKCIFL